MATIRHRIDERKREEKSAKRIKFNDMLIDMRRNPMIGVGLGGSAFFTFLTGLFIGIAPSLGENGELILFGGQEGLAPAVIGIFFGLVYAVSFPVLCEFGTYYWHRKASLRDVGNVSQAWIGYGMMILAGAFTVTTTLAAAFILASLLHTFEAFSAIPLWAQKWTVIVIPVSLAFHAGANIWYDHVSKYAEERREMERSLQTVEIEAENLVREARIEARKTAAAEMAREYARLSTDEARNAGKNTAKRVWDHDKAELGGDADGDGILDSKDKVDNRTGRPFLRNQQLAYGQDTERPQEPRPTNPPRQQRRRR